MDYAQMIAMIRQATGEPIEKVNVKSLGDVYIKKITLKTRGKIYNAGNGSDNDGEMLIKRQASLIAHCIVNEAGARIFGDDQIDEVCDLPAAVLDALQTKIFEVSELNRTVEELAKNSEPTPSASSPSASLVASEGGMSISS